MDFYCFFVEKKWNFIKLKRLSLQAYLLIFTLFLAVNFNYVSAENSISSQNGVADVLIDSNVREHASISISNISVGNSSSAWLLNAGAQIYLDKVQYEALMNGIPVDFVFDVKVDAKRNYIWNRNVSSQTVRRELSLHTLSNQFIVRDSQSQKLIIFLTLGSALDFIANLDNLELPKEAVIGNEKSEYLGSLRLYLDIESLPTPMRLPAYISGDWRLSSGWVDWSVP